MMICNQLEDQLKRQLFEYVINVSKDSFEFIIGSAEMEMMRLLHADYVITYLYNNWERSYELVNCQRAAGLFPSAIDDEQFIGQLHENAVFQSTYEGFPAQKGASENLIIPLTPDHGPDGFICVSFKQKSGMTSEHSSMIKNILDDFFSICNYCYKSKGNDRRNQFLLGLTSRLFSSLNKNEILTEILSAVKTLYPDYTYYLLLSQDYDVNNLLPVKLIECSDDATKRVSTQAFITGDIQIEDRVKEKSTCLYAPLRGNQGVYGVLQIITPNIMYFPQEELTFITRFANVSGQAIENVTLYQQSKHLVADLKLINEVTQKLNSNLQLKEIVAVMKHQITASSNAKQIGFIYYKQNSDDTFDILEGSTAYFQSKHGYDFAGSIMEQLTVSKESVFSGDISIELAGFPYKSIMAIPMQHYNKLYGAVIAMHPDAYYFSFENFKLIQSLIQHSTLAISNTILKEELERSAITDYLTKLYSRSYLDEQIQIHMDFDEKGTLALFDIDDFKQVNDTYGHHVGDEVIKQTANIIMAFAGEHNIAARWGGEELAIYLPDASMEDGVKLASQIRREVENITSPAITLSCGVSSWSNQSVDTVQKVFIRADKALYEAKRLGKNCIVEGTKYQTSIYHTLTGSSTPKARKSDENI